MADASTDSRSDIHLDAAPGCAWPVALVLVVALLLTFGTDPMRDWLDDKDDARLDRLRETTVEECGDRTDSARQLAECVKDTIAATGQKP